MTRVANLMRKGVVVQHRQCDCCGKWARGLSPRQWCGQCEWECAAIGKRVRKKLAPILPADDAPKIEP